MNLLWGYDGNMDDKRESSSQKVNYKRHQVLRVTPRTDQEVDGVLALREEIDGLMYWTEPAKNHSADILVPPDLVADVKEFLQLRGLEFVVLFMDVQVRRKYAWSSTYGLYDLRPQKFNFFCDPIIFAICTSKIINK
jgi:hypothetical protein